MNFMFPGGGGVSGLVSSRIRVGCGGFFFQASSLFVCRPLALRLNLALASMLEAFNISTYASCSIKRDNIQGGEFPDILAPRTLYGA